MLNTRAHDKPVIMHIIGRGKDRKRRIVTQDRGLQVQLARRGVLEEELRLLDAQAEALKQARDRIALTGGFDRRRFAIEKYGWLTNEEIEACCYPGTGGGWENTPYEKLNYRAEELRHTTSRGLKVRSKSELLIAEALYRHGIPFRYEQVYNAGKFQISADFTIRRTDGKLFVWEHEGSVNNASYIEWQRKKAELYALNGFYPWDNLIITYDTEDGTIDLRTVESEICNRLIF